MAPSPAAPHGDRAAGDARLRGAPLTERLPFGLERGRTFDIGRGGHAREGDEGPAPWLSPRHRLVLAITFVGAALVAALGGAAVAAFASGAQGAAAVLGLLTLLAAPLPLLGPAQDWWRHRRGRRVRR
ncbi:hypothetical protein [Sabulicella glaciei]|uniref:Uncharacterized protein n=1 Tax=Sabulicella glaciei TaxID=2984948 RepID=A0ABT3NT41_9PROT|nr:hypothetical protein [Roseococcus sp. MDT2-1-1]MCW8085325.1 hypothetical protein [Roseococcus sp. MDT2-1-1]